MMPAYIYYYPRFKVNVSIPVPNPYLCPTITPISDSFSPICAHACFYSQGCNQCKCMTWLNVTSHYSLHRNGCNLQTQITIYNDLLWKFISNSYYFKKIYFLQITSLHPKFYMPIFLWDVESFPNNIEKLIFAGIGTITLHWVTSLYFSNLLHLVKNIISELVMRWLMRFSNNVTWTDIVTSI
jgi:hypothetical protein